MALMRRAAVLLIANLAVLICVGAWLAQSLIIMQRIAGVSAVTGRVEISHRGEKTFGPLGTARHVVAGDVLRTSPEGGGLTLSWADGSRVRVAPGSTLQIMKCQFNAARKSETYLFRLDLGQVWVRVLKALTGPSKFEIRTPTATAGVRGTVFSVRVSANGDTDVSVLKGAVSLQSKGGAVTVAERQKARASAAGPGAAAPLAAEDAAQWAQVRQVALPRLEVDEPSVERLPDGSRAVVITGRSERGARVTVGGRPVTLDLKAQFRTRLPESECQSGIRVRAADARGFEAVADMHLRR
jgi:hypothetical protein